MKTALDVVREIHTTWEGPRQPLPYELLAEDIEYVNSPYALAPGTRRGHSGFEAAMREITDAWPESWVEAHELIPVDDERVLSLVTFHIQGRESGIADAIEQAYVWTVRDGKAVRFEWFRTEDEAREELGIQL